ncbi:MAG: hypothetical protein LPK19_06510, partial [Hymenobacteraceae bacterium]|nr:hypothetical protein [Hymenobacteraceae bacterium]MDX5395854.1 hypothetical protein [Hymenobacteraceae bacterium]MDX5511909.1 hypothetical protein [Hymenobacteraceae bacterium]
MPDLRLYNPFLRMQFNDRHCFLCGTEITLEQRTSVFPEWLMERYSLADKELLLLDKSTVRHRDLTIPCCDTCHTQHLVPLEQDVKQATEQGLQGWQQLPEKRIFQWLGKIFYGMLVTELIKEQNPLIRPQYAVSENPKMLGKFQSFFQVLQSIRVPIEFDDFLPASVFVIPVKPEQDALPFEFNDELTTMMCSIKLDDVAIVCCLLDNGIIKRALGRVWQDVKGKPLNAKQLAEFQARAYYAAYLLNVVPEYFLRPVKPTDDQIVYDTFMDDVTGAVFNPFEVTAYAHMLEEMLKRWEIRADKILEDPENPLS